MLRGLVIALLAANAVFFAWSQGHLAALGWPADTASEPQRLAQQIAPETVVLLNPPTPAAPVAAPVTEPVLAERPADSPATPAPEAAPTAPASPAAPPASTATACWKVDGLNPEQWAVWQGRIKDLELPDGAWRVSEEPGNGRWILYMGRYDAAQLERKKGELTRLGLTFQELRGGPWAFGISLGSFDSEAAAQDGLIALRPQGVRTARVQPERPDLKRYNLRLEAITKAQYDAMPANGKRLQRCE
jgi:hypothetical protein